MKLHELHVREFRASRVSHSHAVACRNLRIRSVQKNLARAARSQDDCARPKLSWRTHQWIKVANAAHAPVSDEQRFRRGMSDESNLSLCPCSCNQSAHDLSSCRIAVRVQYAAARMRCLARED